MDRVLGLEGPCHNGVPGLMVGRQLALLLRDGAAALFRAGDDLDGGLFDVLHADFFAVSSGGKQGGFV
ncbi:hypothetical protein SDC9_60024 [bioreactor metagenome]|uniref:Uncharacterized protein n=1 Tax=bioreactor metagenome TaxID=1076179 RepID=A0A644XBU0_9ZZZZ